MATVNKAKVIIGIMNDNANVPMEDVLALIVDAAKGWSGAPIDLKRARAYYVGFIRKGEANGIGAVAGTRTRKAAPKDSSKAAKAPKAKKVKVPAPRVAGDREKANVNKDLTVEELNDIRAKNMAKLQAVGRKYAKGQVADPIRSGVTHTDAEARAIVDGIESDLDSFKAPAFLKLVDVKNLV